MRHGELAKLLRKIDFKNVIEEDITHHMLPSLERLYRLVKFPYVFIRLFHLEDFFINATVAADFFPLILNYPKADLFRYNIITAHKL